jgi:hypothetical protein
MFQPKGRRFVKTFIVLLALLSLTGISDAAHVRRTAAIKSDAASPVLTSVIEQKSTVDDYGTVELEVTGLTASGEKVTRSEELEWWPDETHHIKGISDPDDGYWTACTRMLIERDGAIYIVGYTEEDGDRDGDSNSSYGGDIPFEFDVSTQTFHIRVADLAPLPTRFRQAKWTGVRFLVPVNLVGLSRGEAETIIQSRGGCIVGSDDPVDVVVLPDRTDFCPNSNRSRNRLAEKWIRRGALVLWERYFGRPNFPAPRGEEGDWRD